MLDVADMKLFSQLKNICNSEKKGHRQPSICMQQMPNYTGIFHNSKKKENNEILTYLK